MGENREITSARVSVTPSTMKRLREFCDGAGMTYDEVINLMLDNYVKPGESEVLAGFRVRQERQSQEESEEDRSAPARSQAA